MNAARPTAGPTGRGRAREGCLCVQTGRYHTLYGGTPLPAHRTRNPQTGCPVHRPIRLPDLSGLSATFRLTFANIENRELVDTLKRLSPKYLTLCKYVNGQPACLTYPTQIKDDDEFFYRGDGFRLRRTPETDPRAQELGAIVEWQEAGPSVKGPTLMAVRPLGSFFPIADDLLTSDLPHLGEILLVHLNSYQDRVKQHGQINPEYLRAMLENRNVGLGPLPPEPEYGTRQPEITRAVMEAWNWLEREGMVTRVGSTPHWFTISRRGEELLKHHELYERWERIGVERVKDDLVNGGKRVLDVGSRSQQQEIAWEWVRRKESQAAKRPSTGAGLPLIADSRIDELRNLSSADFDCRKLIRLCEELNASYDNGCYIATAALTRAALDHIPPLFGKKTFSEVANNYAGSKSFRELMDHLDKGAKKVADGHLHTQIRKTETLPTAQQVNFASGLDALLAEIVRITK